MATMLSSKDAGPAMENAMNTRLLVHSKCGDLPHKYIVLLTKYPSLSEARFSWPLGCGQQ